MLSRHEVSRVIIALSCSQQLSLEPAFHHPVASTVWGCSHIYQVINLTERSRHLAVPCSKSANANFVAIACIVADLWRFLNFQNNGRLPLPCSILKIQIFKERCGSESIWAESCLEPPKKDGDFIILNNDRPLSWIFTIRNVNGCCDWDGKCAQSRQISEMWVFFDFL